MCNVYKYARPVCLPCRKNDAAGRSWAVERWNPLTTVVNVTWLVIAPSHHGPSGATCCQLQAEMPRALAIERRPRFLILGAVQTCCGGDHGGGAGGCDQCCGYCCGSPLRLRLLLLLLLLRHVEWRS